MAWNLDKSLPAPALDLEWPPPVIEAELGFLVTASLEKRLLLSR